MHNRRGLVTLYSVLSRRLIGISTLATILAVGVGVSAQPRRIVAIGDIHGAIDEFKGIMQAAGLLDASQRWIGGNATFVQTGDYTDRGAGVRAVMDDLQIG